MSIRAKKTTLENGLRVVTIPMKDNKTISIVISVAVGSDQESKKENGTSHFLEHMCFDGTKKYPTARDVSLALDTIGAQNNATTSREWTKYYGTAHRKHIHKLLDVLSDVYLNPLFLETDIEKEKKVIIEEIHMYNDDPQSVVWTALNELLYGDQPAGRTVLGSKENIRSMTKEMVGTYKRKHYIPGKTIVTLAGGISHREGIALVKKMFSGMSRGVRQKIQRTKETQTKPQTGVVYKKTDQTHLRVAFRTTHTHNEKDMWALGALRDVLSGGTSSRLWQSIREDRGLAYYVDASSTDYKDRGTFVFSAGVSNKRAEEALQAILEEVNHIKNGLVGRDELKKVRDAFASRLVLDKQTSSSYAHFYGGLEVSDLPLWTLSEMIRLYRQVTPQDVQRVAKKYFKNNRLNLALIGPFKDAKRFEKLLKIE
jgi:predicted Zn-dependent peptidase